MKVFTSLVVSTTLSIRFRLCFCEVNRHSVEIYDDVDRLILGSDVRIRMYVRPFCLLGSEGIMASSFFRHEDKTSNTVRALECDLVD